MKKIIKENYRVVIEPNYSHYLRDEEREEDARITCESIIDDIKRHVDEVSTVELVFDTEESCEFCESNWEVYEKDELADDIFIGLPVCCNKAQEEFHKQREESNEKTIH